MIGQAGGLFGARDLHQARGDDLADGRFVGIADDPLHAVEGGRLLGLALGVAAGHENGRARILAAQAADFAARVAVRLGGDGAGVDHVHVGCVAGRDGGQPPRGEVGGDGRPVGLRRAAAEVFDGESVGAAVGAAVGPSG